MTDYVLETIRKYKQKGVLIDTNILLVYFVGSVDPSLIPRFKRTATFAIEDYDTIAAILDFFAVRVTTPNILTEVSNLTGQLPELSKGDYFAAFVAGVTLLDEQYIPSQIACANSEFRKFGLTDAGIAQLAKGSHLVFTDDLPLWAYLTNVGVDALNFNHIRTLNW